jgi:hypothetical protein
MNARNRCPLRLWTIVLATIMTLGSAPVSASDTVSLKIVRAGDIGVSLVDGAISRDGAGFLELVVLDLRGSAAGWSVSLMLEGNPNGFSLSRVRPPQVMSGQPIIEAGPHFDPMPGARLEQARRVLWAEPGAGSGNYSQRMDAAWYFGSTRQLVFVVTVGLAP